MGDVAADLLSLACEIWTKIVQYATYLLQLTPDSSAAALNKGAAWSLIVLLNNSLFVPLACALITLFFTIGFLQETQDVHTDIRFETVFKYLIRLGFSEALVVYNLQIITAIFQFFSNVVGGMVTVVGGIGAVGDELLQNQSEILKYIRELSTIPAILYVLLNFLFLLIMLAVSCTLFYTVATRFMKFFVIIPLGSFALATVAGGKSLAMSAQSYIKYIISVAGEVVIIFLAFILMNALGGFGLRSTLLGSDATINASYILFSEVEAALTCLITIGIIKSAQSMLQKALAL